jgi:hypothetical protein
MEATIGSASDILGNIDRYLTAKEFLTTTWRFVIEENAAPDLHLM